MTTPTALPPAEVTQALSRLAGWGGDTTGLTKTWTFPSFRAAMDFIAACVPGIELRNHHPEVTALYDRVSVCLRTHDAGDRVTTSDFDLARHLDQVARGYVVP